jgi:hypothetical protein
MHVKHAGFIKCKSGAALIEFALALPILVALLVGTVEVSRFAILNLKLDKAANAMADFVAQGNIVRNRDLDTFANTIPQIMKPFSFTGTIIFSSVGSFTSAVGACRANSTNCIAWQQKRLGTGNSALGGQGSSNVPLPSGYIIPRGQDLIVAEIRYSYRPLLPITSSIITSLVPQSIYKIALHRPRQGALTTLSP